MCLQSLGFEMELGGFIPFDIRAIPLWVGGTCMKVFHEVVQFKAVGMMCPPSVLEAGLCYIIGLQIFPVSKLVRWR